jgi:hypothetical protein
LTTLGAATHGVSNCRQSNFTDRTFNMMLIARRHLVIAAFTVMLAACGGGSGGSGSTSSSSTPSSGSSGSGSSSTSSGASGGTSTSSSGSGSSSGTTQTTGWLYTKASDNKIYLNSGAGESVWIGRGVNVDDLFLGGYNYTLWMTTADAEAALTATMTNLISQWRPTLLRLSLNMSSYPTHVSWLTNPTQYREPMERVINKIGESAGVYVMVTLRSDTSMSVCDASDDATCFPEAATNNVYRALVDSFANKPHVMFGLSNEPGGNVKTAAELRQAMSAAVDAIRARERELGVPEHIVVVQGDDWTSTIDFYAAQPLTQTNVAYEYHSYPPTSSEYTFTNIPVIIGEYGGANWQGMSQSVGDAFFRDIEAKRISSLAWYFSPYSAVAPALLNVTHDARQITPNSWGTIVRNYLTNPAQYQ